MQRKRRRGDRGGELERDRDRNRWRPRADRQTERKGNDTRRLREAERNRHGKSRMERQH